MRGLGEASLRLLSFATLKCGGWDPFASERWQRGIPADNAVGTVRLGGGVRWPATGGCFGIAPRAAEGAASPFRMSAKLLVVDIVGPLAFGAAGFTVWPMSSFRICEKLCVVVVLAFTVTPCGDLRLSDICIRQASTAVPRRVVGCVFL